MHKGPSFERQVVEVSTVRQCVFVFSADIYLVCHSLIVCAVIGYLADAVIQSSFWLFGITFSAEISSTIIYVDVRVLGILAIVAAHFVRPVAIVGVYAIQMVARQNLEIS